MNFEEISNKLKKISKNTMTEVQKMNEVRQLNARINDEKKKVSRTYTEIGKKVYELYKDEPLEGFEAEMKKIEDSVRMMDLLQDQIRGIKGVTLCSCCNMEVGMSERFCSNCGNKMPETFTIENEEVRAESVIETEDESESALETEAADENEAEPETDGADENKTEPEAETADKNEAGDAVSQDVE